MFAVLSASDAKFTITTEFAMAMIDMYKANTIDRGVIGKG